MQREAQYLSEQLTKLKEERAALPGKFDSASKQVDQHLEQLMEKAGILGDVKKAKDDLEKFRNQLQRVADGLTGKIEVIEHLFDTYHRDPVEPGATLYGIDISKLDWQTRLMVRSKNIQTIQALGGDVAAALRPEVTEAPVPVTVREEPAVESTIVPAEEESQVNYTLQDLQGLVK